MKIDDYEELFDLYESINEKTTVLRNQTDKTKFILRKKINTYDLVQYQNILREIIKRKKIEHDKIADLIKVKIDSTSQTITNYYVHSPNEVNSITFNNINSIIQLTLDAYKGLAFLHRNGLVHGDIRPETICYFENYNCFKLIEKTSWRNILELQKSYITEGKPLYIDPLIFNELLNKDIQNFKVDLYKNDIFALGLVIVEALDREMLNISNFYNKKLKVFNNGKFMAQLQKGIRTLKCPEYQQLYDFLITNILETNEKNRISAEQAVKHIEALAKFIKRNDPIFTLNKYSVMTNSTNIIYTGYNSGLFKIVKSKLDNKLSPQSSLTNRPRSNIDDKRNYRASQYIEADKSTNNKNNLFLGFVENKIKESGESIKYNSIDFNKDKLIKLIKSSTAKRTSRNNKIAKLINTEKKKLSSCLLNDETIEITLRKGNNNISTRYKIIELNDINDLNIMYSKTDPFQMHIEYSIGTQVCRRIINTTDMGEEFLILKIATKKENPIRETTNTAKKIFLNNLNNEEYAINSTIEKTDNSIDTSSAKKLIKWSKYFTHIPQQYIKKIINYKKTQMNNRYIYSLRQKPTNIKTVHGDKLFNSTKNLQHNRSATIDANIKSLFGFGKRYAISPI